MSDQEREDGVSGVINIRGRMKAGLAPVILWIASEMPGSVIVSSQSLAAQLTFNAPHLIMDFVRNQKWIHSMRGRKPYFGPMRVS